MSITVKTDRPVNDVKAWRLTNTYGAYVSPKSIVQSSDDKNVYTMDFGTIKTIWGNTKLGNLEYRGEDSKLQQDDRGINILEDYGKFINTAF